MEVDAGRKQQLRRQQTYVKRSCAKALFTRVVPSVGDSGRYRSLTLLLLLLASCAMEVEPTPEPGATMPAALLPLQPEQVSWSLAQRHIDALEECTGQHLNLDGWSLYVTRQTVERCGRLSFECPAGTVHDQPPSECGCGGITGLTHGIVVVTTDWASIGHELVHVLRGDGSHDGAEWECVE